MPAVTSSKRRRRGCDRASTPGGRGSLRHAQALAVHEQQVRIAVAVVVEEGDAAAHGLRQQALAVGAVRLHERDARLRR